MKYIEAKLDIIAFEAEDVITTSLTDDGEGDFGELFGKLQRKAADERDFICCFCRKGCYEKIIFDTDIGIDGNRHPLSPLVKKHHIDYHSSKGSHPRKKLRILLQVHEISWIWRRDAV